MRGVDAELFWGDERVATRRVAVDARVGRGGAVELPTEGFAPFEVADDEVRLTVPPAATAWVRTAKGWRDLATLRVLGHVAPHPRWPGAARVRLRRLADAERIPEGVVLTPRMEAWIGVGAFWLRLSLNDEDAPAPPRFDRGALGRRLGFAGGVGVALAAALLAIGAAPPRSAALSLDRLAPIDTRMPTVRIAATERRTPVVDTKHETSDPRAAGGATPNDAREQRTRARRRAPADVRRELEGRRSPDRSASVGMRRELEGSRSPDRSAAPLGAPGGAASGGPPAPADDTAAALPRMREAVASLDRLGVHRFSRLPARRGAGGSPGHAGRRHRRLGRAPRRGRPPAPRHAARRRRRGPRAARRRELARAPRARRRRRAWEHHRPPPRPVRVRAVALGHDDAIPICDWRPWVDELGVTHWSCHRPMPLPRPSASIFVASSGATSTSCASASSTERADCRGADHARVDD